MHIHTNQNCSCVLCHPEYYDFNPKTTEVRKKPEVRVFYTSQVQMPGYPVEFHIDDKKVTESHFYHEMTNEKLNKIIDLLTQLVTKNA